MRYILMSVITACMFFSCSTDKENSVLDEESIVGTWSFTGLNIDNADSPDDLALANEVIGILIASGCEILVLDFNSDQTVMATAKDFTETGNDVNAAGTGLLIECPSEVETSSSVWTLEGDQLTFVDENNVEETITIQLDGNTLTLPAEIVDEDNLTGAEAIFTRQ